jgi:hypothetical protein
MKSLSLKFGDKTSRLRKISGEYGNQLKADPREAKAIRIRKPKQPHGARA